METKLVELLDKIKKFRDEREWSKFHNHKDMAISIVLEASELLEHFQWKSEAEVDKAVMEARDKIEEEIADIFIYLLELSDNLGIDIVKAAENKLGKNKMKYPVEKAKGIATKYNRL